MAPEKTLGPSTTIVFAGIELDSVLLEARLPLDKLVRCQDIISSFPRRRKVAHIEILSNWFIKFCLHCGCSRPAICASSD